MNKQTQILIQSAPYLENRLRHLRAHLLILKETGKKINPILRTRLQERIDLQKLDIEATEIQLNRAKKGN